MSHQGQGGGGIRGPSTAAPGGTINVEIGPNETSVELNFGDTTITYKVEPDKTASIPVPAVPPGTVVGVTVGTGLAQRIILVEIVAPAP